jgi:hypothetical protein
LDISPKYVACTEDPNPYRVQWGCSSGAATGAVS